MKAFTASAGYDPVAHTDDVTAEQENELASASVLSQSQLVEQDGKTTLVNTIIERYEGEKVNGLFIGNGVAYFHGGHVYKGFFSDGLMHGRGIYIWADGVKYEGDFVSNVPMGHGAYTWLDGSCYEGEVFNGIRHGIGTYKCGKTSVTYRGQWHHGQRHGKGIMYYNQEVTSWYEGDWFNNSREGWGVRCYPSGNLYEGQWKNNIRHGQGLMRWLQLGQQYNGSWENGIQHGEGTHTWYLRRVPGTQYPLRNEYTGGFVQGLRHGHGTFYYASGAVYKGEWKSNKKHGQGKFIFKNGRIFEGEFIDDYMAEFPSFCIDGFKTPDLSGIRTHTPTSCEEDGPRPAVDSSGWTSVLGPDMTLEIHTLLDRLPEAHRDLEIKQVEFAVLRHISELRSIYGFYSSLGLGESPDNTFLLTRLQLWRMLTDCNTHLQGVTLAQVDRLVSGGDIPPEEIHSPFSTMLLRTFVSSLVILSYHMYHKTVGSSGGIIVACFSKLMRENIIPNAKQVKGLLFRESMRAVIAMNYIDKSWEIHQAFCQFNSITHLDKTMTMRQFIWMFQDLDLFDSVLTPRTVLQILSLENPSVYSESHSNLDIEMVFLEFYEALLGCTEVKSQRAVQSSAESLSEAISSVAAPDGGTSQQTPQCPSPMVGSAAKSSNRTSAGGSSAKSIKVRKSKDRDTPCTPEVVACRQSPADLTRPGTGSRPETGHCEAEVVSDTLVQSMAALDPKEPLLLGGTEGGELESWIHWTHHFFSKSFFSAYEHMLLLRREVEEEALREAARTRTALAKAKKAARQRELWEVEERRREEEEEEEADRAEAQEEDNAMASALTTPVASATSMGLSKHSPSSGSRKKKK
ncbi:radial spoke head 10 homolog B isoform X1 [Sardina pilchardus]|uniref:radial spoke head 10 homolog B isoform X1 n=1 Tax=Sardina pilchardus TaxID=27697 RepID=UPI002E15F5BF